MYPTLFISHGAPNIVLSDSLSKKNITEFSKSLKKPKYVIVFSAHYLTENLSIINYETNGLMYDFYGFEEELYQYSYEINSDKDITLNIIDHLKKHDIDIHIDKKRNTYDHGVWTALSMVFEKLDIPVIQISIPSSFSSLELIKLGELLQDFKNEAMIIASGGLTHNLSKMSNLPQVTKFSENFVTYLKDVINKGSQKDLLEVENQKSFYENHPSSEHFLPLFIAFGNAKDKKGISFNSEIVYSSISMECFIFDKQ